MSNSKKPGCLEKIFYKNRIFQVTKHVLREGLWFFGGHVGKLIHCLAKNPIFLKNRIFQLIRAVEHQGRQFLGAFFLIQIKTLEVR
jgi:hypothetical protein